MNDLRYPMNLRQLKTKPGQYQEAEQLVNKLLSQEQQRCHPTGKIQSELANIATAIVTLKNRIRDASRKQSVGTPADRP